MDNASLAFDEMTNDVNCFALSTLKRFVLIAKLKGQLLKLNVFYTMFKMIYKIKEEAQYRRKCSI